MANKKRSEALIRAQRKYEEANREKRNYDKYHSAARSFIEKRASEEDLRNLQTFLENKLKEFE